MLPLMLGGFIGLYYTPWLLTSLTDVDGNLEPIGTRIALAAILGIVSLFCTLGIWCYQSIYVANLARDGDTVIVSTQGLLWLNATSLPVTKFRSGNEYRGRLMIPGEVSVSTPFRTIAIDGWWLPLLVDDQSRHLDSTALNQLVRDGRKARERKAKAQTETQPGQ